MTTGPEDEKPLLVVTFDRPVPVPLVTKVLDGVADIWPGATVVFDHGPNGEGPALIFMPARPKRTGPPNPPAPRT